MLILATIPPHEPRPAFCWALDGSWWWVAGFGRRVHALQAVPAGITRADLEAAYEGGWIDEVIDTICQARAGCALYVWRTGEVRAAIEGELHLGTDGETLRVRHGEWRVG